MRKDEKTGEENHHFEVDSQRHEGKYIYIENRESDVWFGWYSQWLAQLANIKTAIWFGFQRT